MELRATHLLRERSDSRRRRERHFDVELAVRRQRDVTRRHHRQRPLSQQRGTRWRHRQTERQRRRTAVDDRHRPPHDLADSQRAQLHDLLARVTDLNLCETGSLTSI